MGIFGKRVSTKDLARAAKYELEREKIKQQNTRKQNQIESIVQLCLHAKEHGELYISTIKGLLNETIDLISQIKSLEGQRISRRERGTINNNKISAQENLRYLYLCKEYLLLADKGASGIELTQNQSIFILKFAPFFDGRKVLDDDGDDSAVGSMKLFFSGIKQGIIGKGESDFDFYDMLGNYQKEINELIIPDFEQVFNYYRQVGETNRPKQSVKCNTCSCDIPDGSKFCPSCGTPVEADPIMFCTECGAELPNGAKFCGKCGTKVS